MTECTKCHMEIFWNKEDHERTNKWRPFDEQGNPHNCRPKKKTFKYGVDFELPVANFNGLQCVYCGKDYGQLEGPCKSCGESIAVVMAV